MNNRQRRRLQRRLEFVVEKGRGAAKALTEELSAKLHHLLSQLRDGDWEGADGVRSELLERTNETSGEAVQPTLKFELVKLTTRLFWDAHLRDDSTARDRLADDAVVAPAEGTVTRERR